MFWAGICLSIAIFLTWPHKVLASWFNFVGLLLAFILFALSTFDLWRDWVGGEQWKDKNARRALKKPGIAVVMLSLFLLVGLFLPGEPAAEKWSFAAVADVLLVAGVGFAYWAHESRRLGLAAPRARIGKPPRSQEVGD